MTRRRYDRFVKVELECGHTADLPTGRWRVSEALASLVASGAYRKGVWCFTCNATCQPTKMLGVTRGNQER